MEPCFESGAGLALGLGWALGWAGLGWAGLGWAGLGWVSNPETEIGLFENGKVCLHRKNALPDG